MTVHKASMKTILVTALLSSLGTLTAWQALGAAGITRAVKLENAKVAAVEITHPPGVSREAHVRQTDQVIVFLDNCQYERLDPKTGEKRMVTRKAGEVIWHDKGESAPQLTNAGNAPYRTVVVELKR